MASKIRAIAAAATRAGLLEPGLIERLLEIKARQVADALTAELHGSERVKAAAFLRKAEEASETQWKIIILGLRQGGVAPEIDTTYKGESENEDNGSPQATPVEEGPAEERPEERLCRRPNFRVS